jgi:hypothetical protein
VPQQYRYQDQDRYQCTPGGARGDAVAHIGFLRQGNAPARGQGLDVDAKVFMKHEDGLEAIVQSSGSGSAAPVAPAWPGWGSHCTLMRDS